MKTHVIKPRLVASHGPRLKPTSEHRPQNVHFLFILETIYALKIFYYDAIFIVDTIMHYWHRMKESGTRPLYVWHVRQMFDCSKGLISPIRAETISHLAVRWEVTS